MSLSNLAFSSLAITFSHDERPLVITHSDDHSAEGALSEDLTRVIRVGTISPTGDTLGPEDVEANLRWGRGTTVVISGTVMSNIPTTLNVSERFTVSVITGADSGRLAGTFRFQISS